MSEHNLITVKHMYKVEIGILMFKYHKNLLPRSFNKIFIQKSFHMKTRSSSNVVTSFCRSTVIQQSLKFIGPKVSTLGPLLFLLYINDLPLVSNLNTKLFADDTVLSATNTTINTLTSATNIELEKIDNWMKLNKVHGIGGV